jgi:glutamyl-tRNA reductase
MSAAKKRAKRVVRETHIVKAGISIAIIATLTAHDASISPQNTIH